MKRRNVQLAFMGEGLQEGTPNEADEVVTDLMEGDEAINIDVRAGKLMIVVPAGTPDEEIFAKAKRVGGEFTLEDGRRFSFEIEDGAIGAQYGVDDEGKQEDPDPDLSGLQEIPDGV